MVGAKGENTHFHFLFSEPVGGFQSNSVGIILRGERPKVIHVEHVAPRGAQGDGPPRGKQEICVPNHKSLQPRYMYIVCGYLYR